MRVNVYAEEMTDRIEIIGKEIDGHTFTGLRFYLELPVTVPGARVVQSNNAVERQAQLDGSPFGEHTTIAGPFMHRPGDDDSAAVTFWGKRDLRTLLRQALAMLDAHYGPPPPASTSGPTQDRTKPPPGWCVDEFDDGWMAFLCEHDASPENLKSEAEAIAWAWDKYRKGYGYADSSEGEPMNARYGFIGDETDYENTKTCPARAAHGVHACIRPSGHDGDHRWDFEDKSAPDLEDRSKAPPFWPVYSDGEIMCIDGPTHADCIERAWTVYDAILAPERRLREAAEADRDHWKGWASVHRKAREAAERRVEVLEKRIRTLEEYDEGALFKEKMAREAAERDRDDARAEIEGWDIRLRDTAERLAAAELRAKGAEAREPALLEIIADREKRIVELGQVRIDFRERLAAAERRAEAAEADRIPCQSCGADPRVSPPSGAELPIVKGALDAQERMERLADSATKCLDLALDRIATATPHLRAALEHLRTTGSARAADLVEKALRALGVP